MEQQIVFRYTYSSEKSKEVQAILEKYLPYIKREEKVERGKKHE